MKIPIPIFRSMSRSWANNFLKTVKQLFSSIIALILILVLLPLKVIIQKTIVISRINARYFGHLGLNVAIASSLSNDKRLLIIASFIRPVVNSKLKIVAEKELYFTNDYFLQIFESIYYAVPDQVRILLKNFAYPIIDSREELREFLHYKSLCRTENSWKKTFWATVNNSKYVTDVGILVALRTSDFHGNFGLQNLEEYRNTNGQEVIHILEAASRNATCLPVTYYGSKEMYEKYIEPSKNLSKVKFVDQQKKDILELFQSSQLLINSGNGIGAVASVAEMKVLFVKHAPWHAWHTYQESGLLIPAVYTKDNLKPTNIRSLCKIALNTFSNMPFDYKGNFLKNGIKLLTLEEVDLQILILSIDEILKSDRSLRVTSYHKGISFMHSSSLEKSFWKEYIDNMPIRLRDVHSRIRIPISSSFLKSYVSNEPFSEVESNYI